MTVASLLNITVPGGANGQSATSQGLLMPKLKWRFRVSLEGFGNGNGNLELTKQVVDFTRPNLQFNPQTIEIYNSKVYYAGKPEWQTATLTLRDDASGTISNLVGAQIQRQFDFAEQRSAVAGADYKFLTRFEALDGGNGNIAPNTLEIWEMYGCFISEANYNSFEYNSNDPATITLTIRYDNALQVAGCNGGTVS